MVLITSAKYLDAEFQAEFGKIPPTFLPLGNQRLYEHQVQLFTHLKEKIILSLPKSFQMDATDANKFQKLGITQIAVPDNITLGDSIVYCLNMLFPLNEHLIILHGDTYFSKIPPHINFQQDILSVSFSDIGYSWETLNAQYNTLNTPPLKDYPLIFNGLLSVKDPYLLAKSIL